MKATTDNLRHLPVGTFVLLQYQMPGSHADNAVRLARINEHRDLIALPVEFSDYNHGTAQYYENPSEWDTQLIGDRHVILKVWIEENAWVERKITGDDVGLIVVGKYQNDNTEFSSTVRFRLYEVGNGYARVKNGGSHRIEDYTWWVDPNSRLPEPTPTEQLVDQYAEQIQQTINEDGNHMVDWQTMFQGFGEEFARRFAREHGVTDPAFYSDADADA